MVNGKFFLKISSNTRLNHSFEFYLSYYTNKQLLKVYVKTIFLFHRNTAAELVEQELLFVGNERGKLLELRNIIQKVCSSNSLLIF